ncbi:MAG TPA: integrase, partial [Methylococcaceae bacterium]|nr:integrase [Methylococcaceae bacterium]
MATIRKRISKTVDEETGKTKEKTAYQVQVRLKGFPPQSASFDRLSDAKRWGQQTEAAIKEGRYFKTTEAKRHTLDDLIDRYIETVLIPKKPKAVPMQKPQLLWWKDEIGVYALADVTPSMIVEFRDKLSTLPTHQSEIMSPATVNRHLAALSHA